ncbi:phytanoyl-CoA dioxygenase family protein [Actinoplanes sp. NPDC051346]|uniref:phytanoyl-CoA dioxygenase family protein n=1 Tax=Actinoplanes sp. NPDC051346 TaxID=3155048 RepID=UPI0034462569
MAAHLTAHEKDTFIRDGIIVRRNAIPPELIVTARQLIDRWLSRDMDLTRVDAYTQRTFAPDLGDHPDILALFDQSGVADLVASLIRRTAPVTTAQIQIRLPAVAGGTHQPVKAMHVDGVACPHHNPAELRTFTLLAGVVLSPISAPDAGALHYVPGGHLAMAEWFRSEWSLGMTEQVPPHIGTQHGEPVLAQPGDLLLMHHLVPHAVGHNASSEPRVVAYFRISHERHHQQRLDALRDPWREYEPLQPLLA